MSFERRKIRIGTVVSDKMDKTVVVTVEWRQPYALYKNPLRRRTNHAEHAHENQYQVVDLIRIVDGRPMSKTKRWRVVELLNREEIAELQPDEIVIEELAEQGTAPVAEAEPEAAIADEEATEEIVAEVETTEEEPEAADEEQPTSGESDEDEGEKETN